MYLPRPSALACGYLSFPAFAANRPDKSHRHRQSALRGPRRLPPGPPWMEQPCLRTSALAPARRCRSSSCTNLTLGIPHRNNGPAASDNAILLLHGTGGNAHSLLNPLFSKRALWPRRAARTSRNISYPAGRHRAMAKARRPSDGLHAHFPAYDYDDMVAQPSG